MASHSGEEPDARYDDEQEGGLPPIRLLNILLRRRKLLLMCAGGVALVIVGWTLISDPTYTSSVTLMPEGEGQRMSQLAGIAAQFGIQAPLDETGNSPDFYADLLKSRKVMEATILTEYCYEGDGGQRCGNLIDLYEVEGETPEVRLERTMERLREALMVTIKSQSGTVGFSVSTGWAEVSQAVAERLVELVNDFNLERRQSQAAAERRFLAERSREAREELVAAEDSLEAFLEQNRQYQNSPQLRFEYERLQRRVALQEEVVNSLQQSLEQAKIAEVRNTPVVTVVDPPAKPAKPDDRRLVLKGVLALLLGFFGGSVGALGIDCVERSRAADPEAYREMASIRAEIQRELSEMWSWFVDRWSSDG